MSRIYYVHILHSFGYTGLTERIRCSDGYDKTHVATLSAVCVPSCVRFHFDRPTDSMFFKSALWSLKILEKGLKKEWNLRPKNPLKVCGGFRIGTDNSVAMPVSHDRIQHSRRVGLRTVPCSDRRPCCHSRNRRGLARRMSHRGPCDTPQRRRHRRHYAPPTRTSYSCTISDATLTPVPWCWRCRPCLVLVLSPGQKIKRTQRFIKACRLIKIINTFTIQ